VRLAPALLRAAVGCTAELADIYADHLADACEMLDIRGPVRMAAFLAQLGHESGSLKYTAELWGPTEAQKTYEGRKSLGNTQIGDGYYFRGRGLIQVTGRANYTAMAEWLGLDLLTTPELLEQPRWAALSAATWWARHGCNQLADAGDFVALTRKINGGTNGLEDRQRRWEKAKQALASYTTPAMPDERDNPVWTTPRPDAESYTQPEASMPIPAIVAALLPSVIDAIPKLGALFGSGSKVSERNIKTAETVMQIVQTATNATNAQAAVEKIQADPAALAAAAKAVEAQWFELVEGGGGGIAGARKADAAVSADGDMLHSPSFWALVLLLPLVYMIVGSIAGLWGFADWSTDVRASLATAVVSLIVGGAAGYYWGQTTTRNRTPAS
jgi:putative chitinase